MTLGRMCEAQSDMEPLGLGVGNEKKDSKVQ